jgi:protein-disulfide isomerase
MKLPQVLRAPVLIAGVSSFVFAAACDGAVAPNAPSAPAPAPSKALEAAREAPLVFRVPLGASPSEGPTDARVTLVVFSEFQCPFCAKVVPTLAKLRER